MESLLGKNLVVTCCLQCARGLLKSLHLVMWIKLKEIQTVLYMQYMGG